MSTLKVNTIQEADGSVFTRILQIVNSSQISFTTTSTNTYVDVTNATLTLTPVSSSSKIVVIFSAGLINNLVSGNNVQANIKMLRDSTELIRTIHAAENASGGLQTKQAVTQVVIDQPADTSSHTYKMQATNTNTSSNPTISIYDATLIAYEVAAWLIQEYKH